MSLKNIYLLSLNFAERNLKIKAFPINQIEVATKSYNQIEAKKLPNTNTVFVSAFVSASSFNNLKEAYPNYFSDISQFVSIMQEIL